MSATKLPYFDDKARCTKCDSDTVRAVWHGTHDVTSHLSEYACAEVKRLSTSYPPEHICRTCDRCHFRWAEACNDDPAGVPRGVAS